MAANLILGRYRYLARLGSGGSSTVLLAEDTLLGRRVALKRVHVMGDVTARSRLRREALVGASLSHPNLVSIFDVVTTEDGQDVIVMEYVEGETLAERLRRGDKPKVAEALAMLDGVAAALDAIHARGIVHRDVKPANVLLGDGGIVKLADLGIASVADGTQITTGEAVLGTFRYMAPEQLEGAGATPALDVYALAAVAFEALSGEKARHEPNPLALAHAIATQPPPDLRAVWPEAPAAAAQVLRRGMSRDPARRPRTASELTSRLRRALEPQPTAPTAVAMAAPVLPTQPVQLTSRPRRSRGALVALLATLLAVAAVAVIVASSLGSSNQRLASRSARSAAAGTTAQRSKPAKAPKPGHKASKPAGNANTPAAGGSNAGSATNAASGAGNTASAGGATQPSSAAISAGPSQSPSPPAPGGSPVDAVESFYRLAASHQYAAAWALTDPAFRQQIEGYYGLEATMAQEREIIFNGASVLDESPNNATVSVNTTSLRSNGSQNCTGTVNLLRGGPGPWLLDHIDISCA